MFEVFDKKAYSSDTGALNFNEAKAALEQLYDGSSEDRRFLLRLLVLYTYNDIYRYVPAGTTVKHDENRPFFIENCRAMTEMAEAGGTLRAELFREIGDFEMCLQTLDSLAPAVGYESSVRERIRDKALNSDSTVFIL